MKEREREKVMRERERKREREKSLSRFDDETFALQNPKPFFLHQKPLFPSNLLPKNESNALSIISITDLRV